MSKNKKNEDGGAQQPAHVAELLLKGSTILKAATCEELAAMVDDVPADIRYSAGAVGRTADGTYTLRIDIMKP